MNIPRQNDNLIHASFPALSPQPIPQTLVFIVFQLLLSRARRRRRVVYEIVLRRVPRVRREFLGKHREAIDFLFGVVVVRQSRCRGGRKRAKTRRRRRRKSGRKKERDDDIASLPWYRRQSRRRRRLFCESEERQQLGLSLLLRILRQWLERKECLRFLLIILNA